MKFLGNDYTRGNMERLIGVLCFFLTSCSHSYEYKSEPIARPQQHCDPTIAIEERFIEQIEKQGFTNLSPRDNNHEIGTVAEFFYNFYKHGEGFKSVEEARAIIVPAAEKLLSDFNLNKKIRPYVQKYPVTIKDITIYFAMDVNDYYPVRAPNFSRIELRKGCIIYDRLGQHGMDVIHEESYEEAKRLYLEQQKKQVGKV
jgi:hypothetical protein